MNLHRVAVTAGDTAHLHVCALIVELCDFVLVPSHIEAGVPGEILGVDHTGTECSLKTEVAERTDVLVKHVGGERTGCSRHESQKVFGVTQIPVESHSETVVEETKVDTDVPSLPFQICIVASRIIGVTDELSVLDVCTGPHIGIVGTILALLIYRHIREVTAYRLLTGLTPTETELEVVDHISRRLEERHVVDFPSKGYRGEETPAVVFRETGSTVVTKSEGKEVCVLERIVQTSEERHKHKVAAVIGEYIT